MGSAGSNPAEIGRTNEASRVEWVERQLKTLPAGLRLIDVGAGTQPYRKACSHLEYVAQDVCRYDGEGDGSGLQTGEFSFQGIDIRCDIAEIPERDASYDVVLCTEVLEHVPDPVAGIEEMCRLLKPGGTLIVTVPFVSLTHYAPYHFCTGFNTYFFDHHFARLKIETEELVRNGSYLDLMAQEIRRTRSLVSVPRLRRWRIGFAVRTLVRELASAAASDPEAHARAAELAAFGVLVRGRKSYLTGQEKPGGDAGAGAASGPPERLPRDEGGSGP